MDLCKRNPTKKAVGLKKMRHIMIATDGSEGANRAVDVAAAIAKATGSKLFILTVGGNFSGEEMRQLASAEKDVGAALDSISN